MSLLSGAWVWPDTLIYAGIVISISLAVRGLLGFSINRMVSAADKRADKRRLSDIARDIAEDTIGLHNERQRKRTLALGSLLKSLSTAVIVVVAVLTILSAVGLPIGPLLASAGVGGVALGIGAQSVVRDFISGIFLIVEDQFGVGDLITVDDVTGTVEEVNLRVTRIREVTGLVWYLRNGEIKRVANVSQGFSTAIVDVPAGYNADPHEVTEIIAETVAGMQDREAWKGIVLEEPSVLGVESVTGGTMTVRVMAKCASNKHWGVQRAIRSECKAALSAAGVPGPQVLAASESA